MVSDCDSLPHAPVAWEEFVQCFNTETAKQDAVMCYKVTW